MSKRADDDIPWTHIVGAGVALVVILGILFGGLAFVIHKSVDYAINGDAPEAIGRAWARVQNGFDDARRGDE